MTDNIRNIYMIGICGIAMGSLACMLREAGYNVSGSDRDMYPPMSDILAGSGIDTARGFHPAHMGSPDLVIIGNAISRGNAQAEHVLNRDLPYCSMAEALRRFFLRDREVIAVAGTHGKTTTTALLAHILITAGLDPGCFVGGASRNHDSNCRIGKGKYFVIEADEYDSAFFEKVPKFMYYRPRHLVVTSLEFDHADIYSGLDEIALWFRRLVNIVPSEGRLVYSAHYPILEGISARAFCETASFGAGGSGDTSCIFRSYDGDDTLLTLSSPEAGKLECRSHLFGDFNLANISAAAGMALKLGVSADDIKAAIPTFRGVKRRQELIYSSPDVKIYEDFAHHPTAIRAVLETMRQRYPLWHIWAVYEPRSATSRRNVLQKELAGAFGAADSVLMKNPYGLDSIPEKDRIDMDFVIDSIRKSGTGAALFSDVDSIVDSIRSRVKGGGNHVVLVMSNGGFDGIYGKLLAGIG
jgi:UDP-N-acetylmuramate: L-alanyl-gamma-D-glutamyl-meso-diaminopimelate ligase